MILQYRGGLGARRTHTVSALFNNGEGRYGTTETRGEAACTMKVNATIGDAVNWRTALRAMDIPRRPPHAPRPDRGYVDQAPPETPRPPTVIPISRLEEAMEISRQDEPAIKFPLSVLDELKEPAPPAVSSPAQLAELAMQEDEWVDWTDGHEPEHDEEPGAE